MSGHEILLAVAVFCFAWQRRMSLGQGGVDWDGGEKSGFALYILIYWSRLIDGRALYRGLAFPVGRTTSWRKNRKERKEFPSIRRLDPGGFSLTPKSQGDGS